MPRPLLRGLAVTAAVALGFGAGVVTGVVGSRAPVPAPAPAAAPARGVMDEAAERIAARAARPVSRGELERAAVQGMLAALGDRWSTYYPPTEFSSFQETLEGRYSGVGLWLRPQAAGVTVASVAPGSPAAAAKVRAGVTLLSVDGRSLRGASVTEAAAALRGPGGSTLSLVVGSGRTVRTLALVRASLETEDVTVDRLRGGVSRVRVSSFTRGVGRAVREVLAGERAPMARGVLLDLRSSPGGLLDEAVEVASAFLDGGPVVSYERRGARRATLQAVGSGDTRTPVVVLTDGATASAAEVVAAALQDRRRAVVVGARTYGKGTVQEPSRLSDGSALELTVGRYTTPSGQAIDGVGVQPDVAVAAKAEPRVVERRAVEVLGGLLAAASTEGRG